MREETPYDTSKYQMQPNPELPEAGGVKLAENEKEVLLLELFPMVAKTYLTGVKVKAYEAKKAAEAPKAETKAEEAPSDSRSRAIRSTHRCRAVFWRSRSKSATASRPVRRSPCSKR